MQVLWESSSSVLLVETLTGVLLQLGNKEYVLTTKLVTLQTFKPSMFLYYGPTIPEYTTLFLDLEALLYSIRTALKILQFFTWGFTTSCLLCLVFLYSHCKEVYTEY